MTETEQKPNIDNIRMDEHPDLRLTLEQAGPERSVIVHQAGLIDTYNSEFFRTQVMKVVEAGFTNLIIDAGATTFMSSTAIGAYTSLLKLIRQKNGQLIIYGMPPRIFEVFQLLGFSSFFRFCDTRNDALAILNDDPLPKRSAFPVQFSCPVCDRRLRAVRSGRFRCSNCKVVLAVDAAGDVHLG